MDGSPKAVLDEAFGSPGGASRRSPSRSPAQLRELILTGKLPPGTPLRLSKVAGRMGVSVMPVREAIRILEAERLVTVEPRRGASVARLSIDDIEELYAVRSALEGLAARHGTRHITARGIRTMRTEFAAMTRASDAGDRARSWRHDRRFHAILYVASGPAAARRPDRGAARERATDRRPVRVSAVVPAQGDVRGAPSDPRGRREPRRRRSPRRSSATTSRRPVSGPSSRSRRTRSARSARTGAWPRCPPRRRTGGA